MNAFEQKVKEYLEGIGYTVLRNGWPDFLCYKSSVPPSDLEATKCTYEIFCVEAKMDHEDFRKEQQNVADALTLPGVFTSKITPTVLRALEAGDVNPPDGAHFLGCDYCGEELSSLSLPGGIPTVGCMVLVPSLVFMSPGFACKACYLEIAMAIQSIADKHLQGRLAKLNGASRSS